MRKTTSGLLAGVACGFLALSLCTATVRAESPVLEVTVAGHDFMRDPANPGLWIGTLTLTIDGVDYEGTGAWWITDLKMNKNSFHWFAAGMYDFGALGSFEIWENGKWNLIEPNYGLSGMNRIVGGTGFFEGVHGVLQYLVYEHNGIAVNFLASGHLSFGIEGGD